MQPAARLSLVLLSAAPSALAQAPSAAGSPTATPGPTGPAQYAPTAPAPSPPAPTYAQPAPVHTVDVVFEPSREAALEQRVVDATGGTGWRRVCIGACRVQLDSRFAYRVGPYGGIVESDAFLLDPADHLTVRADVSSRTSLIVGWVLGYGGGVIAVSGLGLWAAGAAGHTDTQTLSSQTADTFRSTGQVITLVGLAIAIPGLVTALRNLDTTVTVDDGRPRGRGWSAASTAFDALGAGLRF